MKINGTNIYMTRGDSESIGVTITGCELKPGDVLEFTVRRFIGSDIVLYKKVTDFTDGKAIIAIMPEDTERLKFGKYVYDIQLTVSGAVKTVIKPSTFMIGTEVTYSE